MNKRKIILDVDTGSDDAVAIIAAVLSDNIQLEAVCTVAGNLPVVNTTENTLRVLKMLGSKVPVFRGSNASLVKSLAREKKKELSIHPKDLPLPLSEICPKALSAPQFYVDYISDAKEPVTIVAVGPLTNIAMALLIDDTITDNIEEIVIMGGGDRVVNTPPNAEYNIWYDPEAAQRVITCGAKITLVPLDATHKALITLDDCARFRACKTPWGDFAAEMCEHRIKMHNSFGANSAPVHDPLCIAYLIDSEVLKDISIVNCRVGFDGGEEGQTVVSDSGEKNVRFAYSANRELFVNILAELFAKK